MKTVWFACFFVFLCKASYGQSEVVGSLENHLENIISALPGADDNSYIDPTDTQLANWEMLVDFILHKEIYAAATLASSLDYNLVHFVDNSMLEEREYLILEKLPEGAFHWGTYVFQPHACRANLVIQAPHPKADLNTGEQSVFIFSQLDAFSLFISGTHRCNSTVASSCSGTTATCSSSPQAYRISDVAHNSKSIFQKTTGVINAYNPNAIFIQLHGFGKDPGDPSMIMSNGTRITPFRDHIATIYAAIGSIDPTLDAKIGHEHLDWHRLLATTNTQGRLINNSVAPCSENATSTSGRFIHIEQEYAKLRADEEKWSIMSNAIEEAFPCGGTVTNMQDVISTRLEVYPNPAMKELFIKYTTDQSRPELQMILYNSQGLAMDILSIDDRNSFLLPHMAPGIYYYSIIIDNKKMQNGKFQKINN